MGLFGSSDHSTR